MPHQGLQQARRPHHMQHTTHVPASPSPSMHQPSPTHSKPKHGSPATLHSSIHPCTSQRRSNQLRLPRLSGSPAAP